MTIQKHDDNEVLPGKLLGAKLPIYSAELEGEADYTLPLPSETPSPQQCASVFILYDNDDTKQLIPFSSGILECLICACVANVGVIT